MDAFIKFDKDGNGHIDFPELQDMFCSTGDKMTHEQVDDFFREADVNKDGKIIYKGKNGMNAKNIGKMMGKYDYILYSNSCPHVWFQRDHYCLRWYSIICATKTVYITLRVSKLKWK